MTAERAIELAIAFHKQEDLAQIHPSKVTAKFWTLNDAKEVAAACADSKDEISEAVKRAEKEYRPYWSVKLPLVVPEGKLWCPDTMIFLVYDDTEEVEVFPVL